MKQEIMMALKNSLIGNNEMLKQSNAKLVQLSKIQGYYEGNVQIPLKQAALIQLKNNIKSRWKGRRDKQVLSEIQKMEIRNAMVLAIIRCSQMHMLIKLYREVLTIVVKYQHQNWIPIQQIINNLHNGSNIAPIFQCIIAVCQNFNNCQASSQKQKNIYYKFIKQILPLVLLNVKNNLHNGQIIYLSLKILWRVVRWQIQKQIKILMNDWMEFIHLTIIAYNQDMEKKLDQIQVKSTPQFYYYHSKKWATRILMRFIQRHAKPYYLNKTNQQNLQYSNFWYQNYGIKFCQLIIKQISQPIPTTKIIRYFQLKVIQQIISQKPQIVISHSKNFQYDILLKYMFITQKDQMLVKDDVVQYLRKQQDDIGFTFNNTKRISTNVWNAFMELGSQYNRVNHVYHPGPLFSENFQFILNKLSSTNVLQKELGMYLLCQNRTTINRVITAKQQIPQILQKYIVPEFTNSVILLRAKANDVIAYYGQEIHNINLVAKIIEGLFKCLTSDQCELVRIKAAIALNPIISHPDSKKLLQPHVQIILQSYLRLIEKYDLEQVISALQSFISDFSESIGPFAVDLFQYISDIFIKMVNKQIQSNDNEDGDNSIVQAASGCIKTMTQILQSPISNQIRMQLQYMVLRICTFILTNDAFDYIQDLMYLMRTHVQKINKITPACWFYFQVLIYFIAGIPKQLLNQIEQLPMPEVNKKILISIKDGQNIQFIGFVIPVIRNYFGKGQSMIIGQKQQFKANFVYLILYLVGFVYRKNQSYQNQVPHAWCTLLLVNLFQTFPPQLTKTVVSSAWSVAKSNLGVEQPMFCLKQVTCQMLCILLWKHVFHFLQIVIKQNKLDLLIKQIRYIGKKLEQYHQRKRVILGVCTYLTAMKQNFQILGKQVYVLFNVLIILVTRNSVLRITSNTNQQSIKKQILNIDDDSGSSDKDCCQNDQQFIWDEQYTDNNVSLLRQINQLAYFKQTMQKLKSEIPQIYNKMLETVPQQKLANLQKLLDKAINLKDQ